MKQLTREAAMHLKHSILLLLVLAAVLLPGVTLADGKISPLALEAPKPKPVEPPTPEALQASIDRAVSFLLKRQNKNGSWGSARNTKGLNIYAPVPGAHHAFRAAVTSLCVAALIDTGSDDEKVQSAIERGEAWMLENLPKLRRATPDAIYNVWGHAYSIEALVRLHLRHEGDAQIQSKIRQQIEQQFELLDRYESVDGGWGYYDFRIGSRKPASSSTSFVNATGLIALHDAKQIGVDPPQKMVQRAIAATLRQRKPDSSYAYGEYLKMRPMLGINRPGGSLGRSQACNLALFVWNQDVINRDVMKAWLDRLFARNGWLDIGRKRPVPHEAWMQVAGYFYYYGHYYAARTIDQLEVADRPFYQAHLAHVLMQKQEKDGSWWDFPFYDYHQQYGTAFALASLVRCRKNP